MPFKEALLEVERRGYWWWMHRCYEDKVNRYQILIFRDEYGGGGTGSGGEEYGANGNDLDETAEKALDNLKNNVRWSWGN